MNAILWIIATIIAIALLSAIVAKFLIIPSQTPDPMTETRPVTPVSNGSNTAAIAAWV